jgi:hypothetical protein
VLGSLRLDGAALERFSVTLEDPQTVLKEIAASELLAADGTFRLEVPKPGRYRLALRAPDVPVGRLEISEILRLSRGDNPWSAQLQAASLTAEGAPASVGSETFLEYRWGDERALSAVVRLRPDANGRFALPIVPAGRGRIVRFEPGDEGWGRWTDLVELELAAGEVRALDLR